MGIALNLCSHLCNPRYPAWAAMDTTFLAMQVRAALNYGWSFTQ